ncbi:hypothetical protein D3C87_1813060 [compost metagenome]
MSGDANSALASNRFWDMLTAISCWISSFSPIMAEVRRTISTRSPPVRLDTEKTSAKRLISSMSARPLKS